MPARRDDRLIFNSRASSRSGGSRSPGRKAPEEIRPRTCSTTCSVSWLCPFGSSAVLFFTVRRGVPLVAVFIAAISPSREENQ